LATLVSPSVTSSNPPTYVWNAVSNATWYQLWVNGAGTWYTASQAHCGAGTGTCSIAGSALTNGSSYTWYVQTYNSYVTGEGPWSAGMSFTPQVSGFDQQFQTTPTNWSQSSGSWSLDSSEYWYTQGVDGFGSTTLYNTANFANFDYSAKLWRNGSSTDANRLYVRSSSTMDSTGAPLDGYAFQYTSGGYYSVWKRVNGTPIALQSWTTTSAINTGEAFNILEVYASGSNLYFSINGIWIWSGSDSSFTSGKVGAGMYRGASTTSNGLWMDYATLTTSADMLPIVGQVSEEQRLLNQHPSVGGSADSVTN
jgi:hypothetical protein